MRERGMFVRFLEYVSIPLSLAGSGFGGRQAARDASHSSKEMLGIATEKQNLRRGNAWSGKLVRFLEHASIQLSLAESRFAGRYEERDASRSSSNKSGIATRKHKT